MDRVGDMQLQGARRRWYHDCRSSSASSFLSAGFITLMIMSMMLLVTRAAADPSSHERHLHHTWHPASATWYGPPTGSGTDGGACGYGKLDNTPYGSFVSAGSPVLFKNGGGCGACYKIKCLDQSICSPHPVRVVITDECPGCSGVHFDLSGMAFGFMSANPSTEASAIRNKGILPILYKRVPCRYSRTNVSFMVNQGSTSYWFSFLVKYENGDGDLSKVELQQGDGSNEWLEMDHLWGAYWAYNGGKVIGPLSIRLTTFANATLIAPQAIPFDWSPGVTYSSTANF